MRRWIRAFVTIYSMSDNLMIFRFEALIERHHRAVLFDKNAVIVPTMLTLSGFVSACRAK